MAPPLPGQPSLSDGLFPPEPDGTSSSAGAPPALEPASRGSAWFPPPEAFAGGSPNVTGVLHAVAAHENTTAADRSVALTASAAK
jgi:hypothetical protein